MGQSRGGLVSEMGPVALQDRVRLDLGGEGPILEAVLLVRMSHVTWHLEQNSLQNGTLSTQV